MSGISSTRKADVELSAGIHWPTVIAGLAFVGVVAGCLAVFISNAKAPPTSAEAVRKDRAAPAPRLPSLPASKPIATWPMPAAVTVVRSPATLAQPQGGQRTWPTMIIRDRPTALPPPVVTMRPPAAQVVQLALDVPAGEPARFQQLDLMQESEHLNRLLSDVPEISLNGAPGTAARVLEESRKARESVERSRDGKGFKRAGDSNGHELLPLPAAQPIFDVIAKRDDLAGLRFLKGTACQTSRREAEAMTVTAGVIRRDVFQETRRGSGQSQLDANRQKLYREVALLGAWQRRDSLRVATLVQMLQVEEEWLRETLVELLATRKEPATTLALAKLALFDVSPKVRELAVTFLKLRPRAEVRSVILAGFRHPWPPVAQHAAEALVALDDREAVMPLMDLLEQPDPAAPAKNSAGKWVKAELVRVNHLGNCLLCHAYSHSRSDTVRGIIPTPGQPLPQFYYESRQGDFVRADIVYLRQDFSVPHAVAKPNQWPAVQRFDYLVRQRELTELELAQHPPRDANSSYPQRDAVLFALRELTSRNGAYDPDSWRRLARMNASAREIR